MFDFDEQKSQMFLVRFRPVKNQSKLHYSSNSGKLELETAAMWLKVFSDFGLGRLFVI